MRLHSRHLALAAMVLLAAGHLVSWRYDAYGLEESGARALVWVWSISEKMITPAAAYGLPDLRALVIAPLGLHWAGSLPAAKVYTLLVWLAALLMLHAWGARRLGAESAMIATGLLAIAPLALSEVDRVGSGIFLVFSLAALPLLVERVEQAARVASVWLVLLWLDGMLAVSLHPAGIGAVIALALHARQMKQPERRRALMAVALLAALLPIGLRMGWPGLEHVSNPLSALGWIVLGAPLLAPAPSAGFGLFIAALFVVACAPWRRLVQRDPFLLAWLLAVLLGAPWANPAWALVVLVPLLFFGVAACIRANERLGPPGWVGKRGGVLLLFMVVATLFFWMDKSYRIAAHQQQRLVGPDRVLKLLADEAFRAPKDGFLAACQWPARALIATHRAVVPLPLPIEDKASFLQQTKGLTHIAFDPKAKQNAWLARMLAALSDRWITVHLLPEGVIVRYRPPKG